MHDPNAGGSTMVQVLWGTHLTTAPLSPVRGSFSHFKSKGREMLSGNSVYW